jgi:hypothetical protein
MSVKTLTLKVLYSVFPQSNEVYINLSPVPCDALSLRCPERVEGSKYSLPTQIHSEIKTDCYIIGIAIDE